MAEVAKVSQWTRTDSKVLQVLSSVLAQQNRELQAVAILECVLEQDPENHEVCRALSGLYLELERFGDALEMTERALAEERSPTARSSLRLVQCHALWGLGRSAEAEAAMRRYVEERQQR